MSRNKNSENDGRPKILIIFAHEIEGDKLGDGTIKRLEKGFLEFFLRGCDYILLTGGWFTENQTSSAAEKMKNWFLEKQKIEKQEIPEEKIFLEEQSRDTYENIHNSLKLLREKKLENSTLFLVSEKCHLRRIKIILRKHKKVGIPIPVKYLSLKEEIKEFFLLLYTYLDPRGKFFLALKNKKDRTFEFKATT